MSDIESSDKDREETVNREAVEGDWYQGDAHGPSGPGKITSVDEHGPFYWPVWMVISTEAF